MTLYGKNEASDLAPKEKQDLKSAIEAELQDRRKTRSERHTKFRR